MPMFRAQVADAVVLVWRQSESVAASTGTALPRRRFYVIGPEAFVWGVRRPTGLSAISGDVSQTLGVLTISSAATIALSGTLSQTLGAASVTAAGVASQMSTAELSATLGSATLAAAGHVDIAASLGVTLGDLVLSASAALALTGALTKTLSGATLSATGVIGEIEADVAFPLRGLSADYPLAGLSQSGVLTDPQTFPLFGLTQD